MQTKPTISQQLKDHAMVWLVNNPDHAIRLHRLTSKVKAWLR